MGLKAASDAVVSRSRHLSALLGVQVVESFNRGTKAARAYSIARLKCIPLRLRYLKEAFELVGVNICGQPEVLEARVFTEREERLALRCVELHNLAYILLDSSPLPERHTLHG